MSAQEPTLFHDPQQGPSQKQKRLRGLKHPHIVVDNVEHKRCSICEMYKPLPAFTREKHRVDGLCQYCRDCKNVKQQQWNAEHADEQQAYYQQYYLDNKPKKNAQSAAWYRNNFTKMQAYGKQYALDHPEKSEWTKSWVKKHPDQARKIARRSDKKRRMTVQGLPFVWTDADEAFTFQYWHYTCAVCGTERGLHHDIALDHWIPVEQANCPGMVPGNILPLCHAIKGASRLTPACNQKKGKKDPYVWLIEAFGKTKARAKLKEIEAFFIAAKQFASSHEEKTA